MYAIVLQWPANNVLTLGAVKTSSSSQVSLLGYGKVDWKEDGGKVEVTFPSLPLNTPLQWAWVIKFAAVN